MRRMVAGLVLVVGAALLGGCGGGGRGEEGGGGDGGPPVLSSDLVEQQVRAQLEDEVGREPEDVTCPGDLTGVVDEQLQCVLSDSGVELDVLVTVTAVDGDDVEFDIQVDDVPR